MLEGTGMDWSALECSRTGKCRRTRQGTMWGHRGQPETTVGQGDRFRQRPRHRGWRGWGHRQWQDGDTGSDRDGTSSGGSCLSPKGLKVFVEVQEGISPLHPLLGFLKILGRGEKSSHHGEKRVWGCPQPCPRGDTGGSRVTGR